MDKAKDTFMHADWTATENIIRLSDYNRLQRLYGRDEIVLEEDEYAIISDFDLLNTLLNPAIESGNTFNIGGRELKSAYDGVVSQYIVMSGLSADMGAAILPDSVVDAPESEMKCIHTVVAADYKVTGKDEKQAVDDMFAEHLGELNDKTASGELGEDETGVMYSTKIEIAKDSVGISVITVFLVLYIGIVFVVACAAIIALKVMSDSLDSVSKFRILSRIGAGETMRKKAVFVQILMNFMIPLAVAAFAAVFGLSYIKGLLSAIGMVNMGSGIVFTFVIMIVVYGGYFLTTYEGCKKLIK
jgi:putative ABC transport system permease protein